MPPPDLRPPTTHRLMRRAALAAVVASSLAGCAAIDVSAPVAPPAGTTPGAWQQADFEREALPGPPGTQALAAWWQRFDDPTLDSLVQQALAANTSVQSAQAAWRQARALRQVDAAALQPSLDASASAQRGKTGRAPTGNLFQAGLDAGWELDVFGGRRAAVAAADADVQASFAQLGDVQVSIAAEVALAYLQLRRDQARLAINRDNNASQDETLQLTRWRNQAGLASSLEVEQATSAAEQTRAQGPLLQASVVQASHSLAVLTGQPPAALAGLLQPAPLPAEPLPGSVLSLPADTLRQRADVRRAERQVAAAQARVAQADAARYPAFGLSGSIGLSALTLGGLDAGGALASALLGSVRLPVWDGGAARATVQAQSAVLDQARQNYRAVVLGALQEVEAALVSLGTGRERLASLRLAAEAAGRAALLARQRYGSGLIDFQVVLDTQRTQLVAEDAVATAQADLAGAHVRLYKALGGGWQPDEPVAGMR